MHAAPRWSLPLALLGAALIVVPIIGVCARVDWGELPHILTAPSSLTAISLSLRTATASTLLCLVMGVPLASLLSQLRGTVRSVARAVLLAPLVLPPVVGGLALLYAFGRKGLVGASLHAWGIDIAFSTTAVIIAQTFVALPFMVLTVDGARASRSGRHEAIAATLGASRSRILWRVTLPALLPAMVAGTVLCFARAMGEFGATLAFAGSKAGVTRTAPLEIYLQRESDPQAAVALSLVMLVVAVTVVAFAYRPAKQAES